MQKGTCVHFCGIHHSPTCGAGINVRQITGGPDIGWGIRIPCHKELEIRDGKPVERAECNFYLDPTDEQIAEDEAEWERIHAEVDRKMKAVMPLVEQIKRENKKKDNRGEAECPACGKGKVRWRIAGYNGHVHMKCSTEGCISFME